MADRKIWTDDEKIKVYIGDDFFKEAYNYFIEGVQNWWTTGKKRVALRNLVRSRLQYLGKDLTDKNIKEMEKQIKTVAKQQQIATRKEQKLQKELIEAGKASRFSPEGPPAPKPLPKVEDKGFVSKLKDAIPVRESDPYPYGSRASMDPLSEAARKKRYSDPSNPWLYSEPTNPTGLGSLRTDNLRIKREVDRALKSTEPPSSSFDRNKDIFHQIAYGIGEITGQDASIGYDYPGELSVYDREVRDYGAKKKGGKVKKKSKKKYTSKKKYSMSRGGIASVRKPTRA